MQLTLPEIGSVGREVVVLGEVSARKGKKRVRGEASIKVDIPMKNDTKYRGQEVRLSCDITGNPTPTYYWFRNNVSLLADSKKFVILRTNWGSSSGLQFWSTVLVHSSGPQFWSTVLVYSSGPPVPGPQFWSTVLVYSSGPQFRSTVQVHSSGPQFWATVLVYSSGPQFWSTVQKVSPPPCTRE
ncbi:hypothetical protein Btru_026602 [Bulinus truncatus]|nr:hypothetical protein Btru_026602 [Bulinus truncatus]